MGRNSDLWESSCTQQRKTEFNSWCGISDTQMMFIDSHTTSEGPGQANPTSPGCYARSPKGCAGQDDDSNWNSRSWYLDTWGAENKNADKDEHQCTTVRQGDFNDWCGEDIDMYFVAPAPTPSPTSPPTKDPHGSDDGDYIQAQMHADAGNDHGLDGITYSSGGGEVWYKCDGTTLNINCYNTNGNLAGSRLCVVNDGWYTMSFWAHNARVDQTAHVGSFATWESPKCIDLKRLS